jgi:hypothetical protein
MATKFDEWGRGLFAGIACPPAGGPSSAPPPESEDEAAGGAAQPEPAPAPQGTAAAAAAGGGSAPRKELERLQHLWPDASAHYQTLYIWAYRSGGGEGGDIGGSLASDCVPLHRPLPPTRVLHSVSNQSNTVVISGVCAWSR